MNKHAVIAIALLGVTGYSFAEEQGVSEDTVTITMTSEIRVSHDMADDVVAEAKKDASALQEKYEPVCGIKAVETTITRGGTQEEITKSCSSCKCSSCSSGKCCGKCSSSCRSVEVNDAACTCDSQDTTRGGTQEEITKSCSSCKCSSCSSGKCCGKCSSSCRSVEVNDAACTCDSQDTTRGACEACEKIKEGNQRKREHQQQQQQTKSVRSLNDDEFCNCQIVREKCADCGQMVEELRCNCGKPRPKDLEIDRCPCSKPKTNTEEAA